MEIMLIGPYVVKKKMLEEIYIPLTSFIFCIDQALL